MEPVAPKSQDLLNPENFVSREFELTAEQAAQMRPLVYECQLIDAGPPRIYRLTFLPGQEAHPPSINFDLAFREASNLVSAYLPGLWHVIARIDDDNWVTLDSAFLSSAGQDIEDIFHYFNEILQIPTLEPSPETFSFRIEKNPVPVAYQRATLEPITITEEHLEPLLSNLPPIPAGTSEHRRRSEEFFQQLIKELFIGEKIHPDGVYHFRKQIYNLLVDAIAPALTPVGLILSDAVAAKLMQQALDRKHSKDKEVGAGVNILREVLRALKKLRTPEMRAFFRNRRISFAEAETYKLRYEEVSLMEVLTQEPEIVAEDGTDFVLPDQPGWAGRYAELVGFTIPLIRDKLILTVDIQKLFNHGMSLRDLLAALKREFDSQHSGMLRFLVSPRIVLDERAKRENKTLRSTWIIAKVVILPDPDIAFKQITTNKKLIDKFANYILDRNQRQLREFTYKVLLIDVVSPILKRLMISGIPGVQAVEVASRTISTYGLKEKRNKETITWSARRLEQHLKKWPHAEEAPAIKRNPKDRVPIISWTLTLDHRKMLLDMIIADDIKYFLSIFGFVVERPEPEEFPMQPETLQVLDPMGSVDHANLLAQELIDGEIKALKPNLSTKERKKKLDIIEKKHRVKGPLDFAHRLYMKDVEAEKKRKSEIAVTELKEMQDYAKRRELALTPAGFPPFSWEKFIVKQELTDIMAADRVNYLIFDGSNVKALIEKSEIDSRTIYSTNTHHMLESFGIGLAKQGVMLRLASVMGDENNYIDPSYILMLAEILCNRGKYYGTSYEGLKQQQTNVMSLITAEQPMKALLKMAKHSVAEASSGVSVEMMLGLESKLGGGAVDLVIAEGLITEMAERGLQFSMADIESYLATRESIGKSTPSLNVTKPREITAESVGVSMTNQPAPGTEFPTTNTPIFSPAMYGIGQRIFNNTEIVDIEPIEAELAACPPEPVRAPTYLGALPVLVPGSLPKSRQIAKYLKEVSE
jgi:hypothetical protein